MTVQYYVKAVYAGLMTALGQLSIVLVGDSVFADISNGQWVVVAFFSLGAFGGILGWQSAPATMSTSVK